MPSSINKPVKNYANKNGSSHPHNRLQRLFLVEFGVDFGDGGRAVTEDDASGFKAELLPRERGRVGL